MNELSSTIADFLKILSDSIKLDIIDFLKDGKKSAKEIQDHTGISQAYCSQELQQLVKEGLLSSEKIDNIKYYGLTNQKILSLLSAITSYVLEIQSSKTDRLRTLDNIKKLS